MGRKSILFFEKSDIPEENLYRAVLDRAIRDAEIATTIDTRQSPANQRMKVDVLAHAIDALSWLHEHADLMFISGMAGIDHSYVLHQADAYMRACHGQSLADTQRTILSWAMKHAKNIPVPAKPSMMRRCLKNVS